MALIEYSEIKQASVNTRMKSLARKTKQILKSVRGNCHERFDQPKESIVEKKITQLKKAYNKKSKTDLLI